MTTVFESAGPGKRPDCTPGWFVVGCRVQIRRRITRIGRSRATEMLRRWRVLSWGRLRHRGRTRSQGWHATNKEGHDVSCPDETNSPELHGG